MIFLATPNRAWAQRKWCSVQQIKPECAANDWHGIMPPDCISRTQTVNTALKGKAP
jgi:hypothetical protein